MASSAARPKHLRLLRPFVLGALAAGTCGTLLGFILLERSQWRLSGAAWPLSQVHAQLQLFGFLLPFVVGFAIFLVPRLSGGEPITGRGAAWTALVAFAAGMLLTAAEPFTRGPWAVALRRADAIAVLAGTGGAAWALRGPISRFARALGGRSRAGYLWLFELALAFLVLSGIADAIGLWTAGGAPLPLLSDRWARAAWRLALDGFAVGIALGVAARMFTGFLGISPGRAYPAPDSAYRRGPRHAGWFWVWVGCWMSGVALAAVGEALRIPACAQAGELSFAVGILPLSLRLGLARVDPTLSIDRSQDAVFPFGARASFALLVFAALVGAGAAVAAGSGLPASPAWVDVRRHLIALGFVMTLIATMAGRLAPGFARSPMALPQLRRLAMGTFVLAALLRVGEGVAWQWGYLGWLTVSAASGPVALLAFAALFTSLGVTVVRARKAG